MEITDLYSELWSIQKKPGNKSSIDGMRGGSPFKPGVSLFWLESPFVSLLPELQNRLDGLIGALGDNENLKSSKIETF